MADVLKSPEDCRKYRRIVLTTKQKMIQFGQNLVGKKTVITKAVTEKWHKRNGRKIRP